jgi:hypothetical protein
MVIRSGCDGELTPAKLLKQNADSRDLCEFSGASMGYLDTYWPFATPLFSSASISPSL